MKLFDKSFGTLEHALDVRTAKQMRLASNLANLDTPGFRPQDVDFEASIAAYDRDQSPAPGASTMTATRAGHMDAAGRPMTAGEKTPAIVADDLPASTTLDDNSVDLDHTMAELAENNAQFSVATKVMRKKLALLRYVASDGAA